jgi:GNAT superfamily N-acetyltransferase
MEKGCPLMLSSRKIDIEADRDTLLELHCRINYESATPLVRGEPYEQYRMKWLSTSPSQPEIFLKDLAESMTDERTIAEIWEDGGAVVLVGYLWVKFSDLRWGDEDLTIAEVYDLAVTEDYQRRGIGRKLLAHAEQLARERGADILRSGTGIENTISQKLHTSSAFKTYYIQYEKLLTNEKLRGGR